MKPIVSPEDWEKVQELIDRRPPIMEGNACPFYNLFHVIYCAACGKSMQVRYEEENQKQLKELSLSLRRSNEQESDVHTFIREIQQYATVRERDESILNCLISRILAGEVKKINGGEVSEN